MISNKRFSSINEFFEDSKWEFIEKMDSHRAQEVVTIENPPKSWEDDFVQNCTVKFTMKMDLRKAGVEDFSFILDEVDLVLYVTDENEEEFRKTYELKSPDCVVDVQEHPFYITALYIDMVEQEDPKKFRTTLTIGGRE